MRFIPTLALAVLSATASARVIERNTFGGEAEGDARFATQALTHGIRSHLELQRGEETSLAKIEEMTRRGQTEGAAHATGLSGDVNDLASIVELQQEPSEGVQQEVQDAIDKRQTNSSSNNNYSNNANAPDPFQTGWIFGAIIISLALVLLGILILRKRRMENLKRSETHEMKVWEDALT